MGSTAAAAAVETPTAAPETIADVLASPDLDQFRDALPDDSDSADPIPPQPKAKPAKSGKQAKPAAKQTLKQAAGPENESDAENDTDDSPADGDEDTKPDIENPKLPDNEEAEEAAFSDEALATPEGVAAAREIVKAAREAVEKRTHILDRYDMRSKKRMNEARELATATETRSKQVEGVAMSIARDLQIFREPGTTAREKLGALSRLAGGRPGHEVIDELTAGILSDGKPQQEESPRVRDLERKLLEQEQRWEQYLQQQQAAQVEGQTAAQKAKIAQVYAQIQEEAADPETYPEIAAGLEEEDWTPEEVAQLVAGPDGIMVKHHKRTGERLDKSEALRILEGRLARRRGTAERAPQGAIGTGAKKPGSPTRGVGRGTTITPSVADRSAGSVRELNTPEERRADLLRDPVALKQLFPMLG